MRVDEAREPHDVFQSQLYVFRIGVFEDLDAYSWIHSTGGFFEQMVHLKRGYGNFPTYGEMNHWQRCIAYGMHDSFELRRGEIRIR